MDPADATLADLLAQARRRPQARARCVDTLRAGGAAIRADVPRRADGRDLAALLRSAPQHRSWAKRMRWRAANLDPTELAASLTPLPIELPPSSDDLIHRPPAAGHTDAPGTPFVVVGPAAVHRVDHVHAELTDAGAQVVDAERYDDYPALAWDLYDLARDPLEQRRRTYLRFQLDRALYGRDADRCAVLRFTWPHPRLRPLKRRLRRALGPMRFYRATCGPLVETCFCSFVHLPDPHRVDLESARLRAHGIG